MPEGSQPSDRVRLSSLVLGEQFVYTFDLGDDWTLIPFRATGTAGPAPWTPRRNRAGFLTTPAREQDART